MRENQFTDMKKVFTTILAAAGIMTFSLVALMLISGFFNASREDGYLAYRDDMREEDVEYFMAEEASVETQFASGGISATGSCWVSPTTKQACGGPGGQMTSSVSYIYHQTACAGAQSYKRINDQANCSNNGTGQCFGLSERGESCGVQSLKNPGNNYSTCYNIGSACMSAGQPVFKKIEQCVWVCGTSANAVTPMPTPTATIAPTQVPPAPSWTPIPTTTPVPQNVLEKRVLFVSLNPSTETTSFKQTMNNYTTFGAKSWSEFDSQIANYYVNKFNKFTGGSVKFSHVGTTDFTTLPNTRGNTMTFEKALECANARALTPALTQECTTYMNSIDYAEYFRTNRLCSIANQHNADMIWLYTFRFQTGQEFFYLSPSQVVGANTYIDPTCQKPYIVIIGNYTQPYYSFLHHFSHHAESTLQTLTNSWSAADKERHFSRFARMEWYGATYLNKAVNFAMPTCGNTHYPGNTKTNYGYSDRVEYNSACGDWKNFPNYTNRTERISCTAWGCTDNGWQEYFLSSLPNGAGEATLRSLSGKSMNVKRNWWTYVLDLKATETVINSAR